MKKKYRDKYYDWNVQNVIDSKGQMKFKALLRVNFSSHGELSWSKRSPEEE